MTKEELINSLVLALREWKGDSAPTVKQLFTRLKEVAAGSVTDAELKYLLQMRVCDVFTCDMELWEAPKNVTQGNPLEAGRSTKESRSTELGLSSTFSFGKYSGKTVEEVLAVDPGYIKWMAENVGRVKFSSTVLALLD